eukprot:6456314-Amphidinium_carterae.1
MSESANNDLVTCNLARKSEISDANKADEFQVAMRGSGTSNQAADKPHWECFPSSLTSSCTVEAQVARKLGPSLQEPRVIVKDRQDGTLLQIQDTVPVAE